MISKQTQRVAARLLCTFTVFKNPIFARLFVARITGLLGDAFTWVGLALLAYQTDKTQTASILATALTVRVTAFIIVAPLAGLFAERYRKKQILIATQLFKTVAVAVIPFVSSDIELYISVFVLNMFSAIFSPTYRAVIPQIVDKEQYRQAQGLSMATFQVLSVIGPALAGAAAIWLGINQIFFINGALLFISMLLISTINWQRLQKGVTTRKATSAGILKHITAGMSPLFKNPILRFALSIEFISAIAGAFVLVNTVNLVKSSLQLDDSDYGTIMSFFGLGAAITAFILGSLDKSKTRRVSLISGVIIIALAISAANFVTYDTLLILWILAGIGQTLADMPSETLIGENIAPQDQSHVFGAHFAISHLWWAIAYPVAGYVGQIYPDKCFMTGGAITFALSIACIAYDKIKMTK